MRVAGEGFSRPDHRAVAAAGGAPAAVEGGCGGEWELGGQVLIDVDAEARGFFGVHRTILDLRAAGEDVAGGLREPVPFVDAKVVVGQLEGKAGRMADRRAVAGAVPRGLHAEELRKSGHLTRHAQAAD